MEKFPFLERQTYFHWVIYTFLLRKNLIKTARLKSPQNILLRTT